MTSQLRTYESFIASLRSFEDWVPGTGVTGASDVDFMLERRGRFLFIEAKPREGPQIYVSLGQWIALTRLSGQPNTTVWLLAEDERAKKDAMLPRYSLLQVEPNMRYHKEGWRNNQKQAVLYTDRTFIHLNLAELQAKVRAWWEEASD